VRPGRPPWAVAREQVLDSEVGAAAPSQTENGQAGNAQTLIGVLDTIVGGMTDGDFLIALPALRQAFTYFPPRERDIIARALLDRHQVGSLTDLRRNDGDPLALARAAVLESDVDSLLARDGLVIEVAR
jgi:hypothetical protein